MTRLLSIAPLVFAILIAGCSYPDQFRNANTKFMHAVLIGGEVRVMAINGQPTSFWRSIERFRIPLGTNVLRTAYSDRHETIGYEGVRLVATAGSEYVLSRKLDTEQLSPITAQQHPTTSNAWVIHDRRDCVFIEQIDLSGQRLTIISAPREDYIFGISSSSKAITRYRQQNP